MKKLLLIIVASLLFLFGTSLICFGLELLNFTKAWVPLVIGSSIIILSVCELIIFLKTKKNFLLYSIFFINMISMGFLIKSWHIFKGYNLELYTLLLISLLCVCYLLLFYLISYIPIFSNHYSIFLIIYLVISVIAYIVLIIVTKTSFLSTCGYYMIIEIGFLLAMSVYTDNYKALIKTISLSTFLVVVVAIIIAILMLDGEPELDFYGDNLNLMSPKEQSKWKNKI